MNFQDISYKWTIQNQDIGQLCKTIPLYQFVLDQKRRLASQFKILTFMTQTQYHLEKLYSNPDQLPYNRNPHIMTFNHTKPVLTNEEDKDKIENYINANVINFEGKKCIATQGPLTSTFYNFYRMIEKYNITSIFMLCSLVEKNRIKCDRYWPNQETEGGKMIQKQYEITLISQIQQEDLKVRKFHIKNNKNNYQTILTQYQITSWPDGDRPAQASKKTLDYMEKQFLKCYDVGEPPVVHCGNGVGSTGAFIAKCIFRKIIEQKEKISIFELVRQLREQRWGLVYTFSQYEYLYDYVDQFIMVKKNKEIENQSATSETRSNQNQNGEKQWQQI